MVVIVLRHNGYRPFPPSGQGLSYRLGLRTESCKTLTRYSLRALHSLQWRKQHNGYDTGHCQAPAKMRKNYLYCMFPYLTLVGKIATPMAVYRPTTVYPISSTINSTALATVLATRFTSIPLNPQNAVSTITMFRLPSLFTTCKMYLVTWLC